MAFDLETTPEFDRSYRKYAKKNPELERAVENKLSEILKTPFRFKSLRQPLQGFKRVHILRSFVLIYKIENNSVVLIRFKHHDDAYR